MQRRGQEFISVPYRKQFIFQGKSFYIKGDQSTLFKFILQQKVWKNRNTKPGLCRFHKGGGIDAYPQRADRVA